MPPIFEGNANGNEATEAWTRQFSVPHVRVKRGLPDPLVVGNRLGSGGVGEVYETRVGGVPVALKRIYTKSLTEAIFAEVNIMRQMTKKRHHHIVQLIGSYEKRHINSFELGLLIWPVATCDLAALLHDFDIAHAWWVHGGALGEKTDYDEEDVIYAIETLTRLESITLSPDIIKETDPEFLELYKKTRSRLQSSIGCIANAVEWLHDRHIRHKDLKPSQVLISASGLWLSDFGWSKDVSEMTCSTTVGGKTTTPKYLAPERALKQPCGRPEDIFSLGCIFLEIGHQVFRLDKPDVPWFQPGWLYSKNVEQVRELASTLVALSPKLPLSHEVLMALVVRMLNEDPAHRPSIIKVVDTLAAVSEFSGHCCSPTPSRSSSINNAKFRVSQSVDHRTTPFSPEGSYFPVPHSQFTSNGHDLSYQDSNSMFARGHKRSLAEASSGYRSDRAPTERTRPDYSVDDPRRLSTSGATNDMSKHRQLSMKIAKRPLPPPPPPPTTKNFAFGSQVLSDSNPLSMALPAESQQFVGSILDPNDPRTAIFISSSEHLAQPYTPIFSYNPFYSPKALKSGTDMTLSLPYTNNKSESLAESYAPISAGPTFNGARESTTISPGIAHAKQLQLSRTPTELFTKQPLLLETPISTGPESTLFFSFGPRINVPPPVPPAVSHLQPQQHFEPECFEISRFEPRHYYSYSEATTPPRRLRSSTPR